MNIIQTETVGIFENIIDILPILTFLFGGGIGVVLIKGIIDWRKEKRSFDIKMNELIQQNIEYGKEQVAYVPRVSLERHLDCFINSISKICKISGSAGSGKTRFALNIINRNKLIGKYHYVYIDKNNGEYFTSSNFKDLDQIQGRRRYIFIFDYVYENRDAIKSLLQKTSQTQRHKYIFIEREYNWWEFNRLFDEENDFIITMESHKMDSDMLTKVFYNSLSYELRKKKNVQEDASAIIKAIINKIDPIFTRPIFSKIAAGIYKSNPEFDFDNVNGISQMIESYWYTKFSKDRVGLICFKHNISIDDTFMAQLEILLRIILLIATISGSGIIVKKSSSISFIISANNTEQYSFISDLCDVHFLNIIESLPIEGLRQLFGVILKEHIKINRRKIEDRFEIISELDIISEWVFLDSVKENNSWIKKLIVFFKRNFREGYNNFLKRGSLDFLDLVEQLEHSSSSNINENEYLDLLIQRVHEVYQIDNSSLKEAYKKNLLDLIDYAQKSFPEVEFYQISKSVLLEIKKCHNDKKDKRELTEELIDKFGA